MGKTPERISVSEEIGNPKESIEIHAENSKAYVIVIIGVLLIFASGTVYIFGPMSCLVVFAVLTYWFFTNFKRHVD